MKQRHQDQIFKPTFLIITVFFLYWLSVQFIAALITISVLVLLGSIVNKNCNTKLINQAVSYFCESFLVILISPLLIIKQIKDLFIFLKNEFDLSSLQFVLAMSITSAFLFAPIVLSETLNALLWYSAIALFSLIISMCDSKNHFDQTSNNGFFLGFVLTISLVIFGLIPNFITITSLILFNIGALIITTKPVKSISEIAFTITKPFFTQSSEISRDEEKEANLSHVLNEASNIVFSTPVAVS